MKHLNLFILCALLAGCSMNELGKSSKTVTELAPDFYSMTVTGDAGFDLFLAQGGASSADELGVFLGDYLSAGPYGELKCKPRTGDIACSALRAKTSIGRTAKPWSSVAYPTTAMRPSPRQTSTSSVSVTTTSPRV